MDDGKKEYMMYGGRRNGWDKDRMDERMDGRIMDGQMERRDGSMNRCREGRMDVCNKERKEGWMD